jgi:hypothetical protein
MPFVGTLTMTSNLTVLTRGLWWHEQAEIVLCLKKSADLEMVIQLIAERVAHRHPSHMDAILDGLPTSFHNWGTKVLNYMNLGTWGFDPIRALILEGLRIGIYSDQTQAKVQLTHYFGLLAFSPESPAIWDAIIRAIGPEALLSALESDGAQEYLRVRTRIPLMEALNQLLEEQRDL